MAWELGGILLWLGGWWFTGRLFPVYSKAVSLEEADRRRSGAASAEDSAHRGAYLFMVFDLGLLLLGVHSLALFCGRYFPLAETDVLAIEATQWSVAFGAYVLRQAIHLHRFVSERDRARHVHVPTGGRTTGTLRGLLEALPIPARVLVALGLAFGAVPLAALLADLRHPFLSPSEGGEAVPFLAWFVAPAILYLVALRPVFRRPIRNRSGGTA